MKLNCLIIDDEPMARKGLEEYTGEVDFLNRLGSCEDALKASQYLNEHNEMKFLLTRPAFPLVALYETK